MAVAVAGPADALDEIDPRAVELRRRRVPAAQQDRASRGRAAALHATTIWLGENPIDAPLHGALLQPRRVPPPAFETFERLFEVVSVDDADREAARGRWKTYARRGYPIKRPRGRGMSVVGSSIERAGPSPAGTAPGRRA
jgi:DNA polymerase-3 subunit chi